MSNEIPCKLKIRGKNNDVLEFEKKYIFINEEGRRDLSFDRIIPTPEVFGDSIGSVDWQSVEFYLSEVNPDNPQRNKNHIKLSKTEFIKQRDAVNNRYDEDELKYKCTYNLPDWFYKEITLDEAFERGKKIVGYCVEYGAMDWSEWRYKNWGDKKDDPYKNVSEIKGLGDGQSEITIDFIAAWYPHVKIAQMLINDNPDLDIKLAFFGGPEWINVFVDKNGVQKLESLDEIKKFGIKEGFCMEKEYDKKTRP